MCIALFSCRLPSSSVCWLQLTLNRVVMKASWEVTLWILVAGECPSVTLFSQDSWTTNIPSHFFSLENAADVSLPSSGNKCHRVGVGGRSKATWPSPPHPGDLCFRPDIWGIPYLSLKFNACLVRVAADYFTLPFPLESVPVVIDSIPA